MVDVLDSLFDLPVTLGAVGVLQGRQCAPGDKLGKPHHPLESAAVAEGAVAIPGGDAPLTGSCRAVSLKVCECLRGSTGGAEHE